MTGPTISHPETAPEAPEPATVEPLKVLIPSQIGLLGLEFHGSKVARLVIQPSARLRKTFRTLTDLRRGESSEFLEEAVGRFSEYFAGARRNLDLEADLSAADIPPFARRILKETQRIPYGTMWTYQKLAASAGEPEAYRQVRAVLVANPIPIVVPCHRVVPGRGGVGSYVGGVKKKQWLLRLERRSLEEAAL
jgi:O-6-methylguanine DNA methyltransferase